MCKVLKVSRAGYYAWGKRQSQPPSERQREQSELGSLIAEIHARSRGTYGRPRIMIELQRQGIRVGGNRVRRIMSQLGLQGRRRRKYGPTAKEAAGPIAPNLLRRRFKVDQLNQVWCGDVTQVLIGSTWLYLAVVIDLCSRRVVGLSAGEGADSKLVMKALAQALVERRPAAGVVFHSDQGSAYRSARFRRFTAKHDVVQSMSRKGNCLDNAVAESFFATLKHELVSRRRWRSLHEATAAIRDFALVFYNQQRTHSWLGYRSPQDFESHQAAA